MKLGSIDEARAIVNRAMVQTIPMTDHGAFRTFVRVGSIGYKVPNTLWQPRWYGLPDMVESSLTSLDEHEFMTALRHRGARPFVPPTTLYVVRGINVVAVPFYPYSPRTVPAPMAGIVAARFAVAKDVLEQAASAHWWDDHDGNWRATARFDVRLTDLQPEHFSPI